MSNTPSCSLNSHANRPTSRLGATSISAIERWSWLSCRSTRPAVAKVRVPFIARPPRVSRSSRRVSGCCPSAPARSADAVAGRIPLDEREERGIRIDRARVGEQAVRCRVGDDAPRAHEHEPVAAQRLVHDVAADDERGAARRRARGRVPTARRAAPGRARPSARRAPAARASRASRPRARRGSPAPPLSESMVWSRLVGEARPASITRSTSLRGAPMSRAK